VPPKINWKGKPLFSSTSKIDIIRQNFQKKFYFQNLLEPKELEWMALSQQIY
ncbi:Hypothetical protein FKW44_013367, partial [Caligus rogercresseyi]